MTDIKNTYDPTKNYGWEPTTEFILTGIEFGSTLQFFQKRKIELLRELDVINTFEKKLREGVENGSIKEITDGDTGPG